MSSVRTTYRQGRTEFDAVAFGDYAVRQVVDYDDLASNVLRLPLDAGKHVLGVRARVATAFVSSGAAATVKIGDSADDDGYLKTTDLDITALNAVIDSRGLFTFTADTLPTFTQGTDAFVEGTDVFTVGTPDTFVQGVDAFTEGTDVFDDGSVAALAFNGYAKGGKYYTSPNYLLLTFAGTLTAGSLILEVLYDGYQVASRDELVNQ